MTRALRWPLALVALAAATALPSAAGAVPPCERVAGRSSSWTSCPSRFGRMSPAERATLLVAEPPAMARTERGAMGPTPAPPLRAGPPGGLPEDLSFSWHDLGGDDWLTDVRDQGSCGACFVFGSLAAVESQYKWLVGDPLLEIDLSEQSVISCISLGSCDSGGTAQEVGMHLASEGVTDEACYPYTASDGDCDSVCADASDRRSSVSDWHTSVLPWSIDEIKAQLVYGPVVANMQVYSDFYDYHSGVYSRGSGASAEGWHVVAIVGWDDAHGSWIARNSWGDDFGQEGYFEISRSTDCTLWLDGVCFASNVTYFDVEESDIPGLLCAAEHEASFEVEQGEAASTSLDVRNCGVLHSIDLSGETVPSASWLDWSAGQESLAVGESTAVELTADSSSLEPGTHETVLRLTGGSGTAKIHVTFVVHAPPPPPDPPPGDGGAAGSAGSAPLPWAGPPPTDATDGSDEGGCGCRLASPLRSTPVGVGAFLLAAGAFAARRRPRRGSCGPSPARP